MADHSICKICWGLVTPDLTYDARSKVLAVWPAPSHDDVCFRRAGFDDFLSDRTDLGCEYLDSWDKKWHEIVERAVAELSAYGAPRMRQKVEVVAVQERSFFEALFCRKRATRPVELSIVEQLVLLTHDDQFPEAEVDFGDCSGVSLRTSLGHAILWVTMGDGSCFDHDAFVATLASGRSVERMELDWKHLF